MNLHPIVVHFPVALLTVYALFELIRFRKLAAQSWWFPMKAVLVMVGGVGALAARQTGELIENEFQRGGVMGRVLEAHQLAANATIAVFGTIAAAYLVTWVLRSAWGVPARPDESGRSGGRIAASPVWGATARFVGAIAWFIMRPPVIVVGALFGLFLVTVTGGLGGILAYGPDVDPVTKLLFSFF
ncbi:MAG: hypothetical protein Q7S84_04720 [bacterium]|nr:hypothetical protein [bacterium]